MPTARSDWKGPHHPYSDRTVLNVDRVIAIEGAILDYHKALDSRQHGDVAAHNALSAIEAIMGMHWRYSDPAHALPEGWSREKV